MGADLRPLTASRASQLDTHEAPCAGTGRREPRGRSGHRVSWSDGGDDLNAVLLLLARSALAQAASLELAPLAATVALGEPVWVELTVTNEVWDRVDVWVLDGVVWSELELEATDATGRRAIDPRHDPRSSYGFGLAGNIHTTALGRGASVSGRIDVARYAHLGPGTWDVRARWDAGSPWATTRLTVRPVTEAEARAIVAAHPAVRPPGGEGPDRISWSALGHPVYVPILEPLAATELDGRALAGLAACPCVEATEALFRLYDLLPEPERSRVGDELLERAGDRPELAGRTWDERYREPLLERGRATLAFVPEVPFGVEVVGRFGGPSDVPLLVRALQRVLVGSPSPGVDDAVSRLLRVLAQWPAEAAAASTTDPRARLLLDLLPWDGRTGEPPVGWEGPVVRALRSGDRTVAKQALERLPALTPALVAASVPYVGTWDRALAQRLRHVLADPLAREALRAALPTADRRTKSALHELLRSARRS